MKFHNGHWLNQRGTAVFSPKKVWFVRKVSNGLEICAPAGRVEERGDTLGGVNLTLRVTAPAEGILRMEALHYAGAAEKQPVFQVNAQEGFLPEIEESEQKLTVRSGSLRLEISRADCEMRYYEGDQFLASESGLAYIKENWAGLYYDPGTENAWMRQGLSLSVGELIYGLGERFTPFVKNGQSVEIWNEDGGTSTEQAYKNIPFYLSSRGYGVFVDHPGRISFEVGSEIVTQVSFSARGESLAYYMIAGPTMKEALGRYTRFTGKAALPPAWTFGLWLSTSFTTDYDEKTVSHFVDEMFRRDIPLSVFHFDCFWMKEFCWCDFTWDERVFPDPAGMLARLHEKGLKICVWINSYVGQESILFEEGRRNGYFLKRPDGSVWQWDMWQPGMALVDFTNPEAREWYGQKLENLLDMGVDCFKTDFGERIPTDAVYYDGSDPERMHNYYTYLYNKTVFEVLEKKRGKGEAVLFARSATAGGQQFPVHWGGDCWSDFPSMAETLRGGLSLGMSGFSFWSHDIGGFEQTATPDVYKRWVAFGLLSSHSRLHGSSSYRVPWAYDEEAVDVLRFFTKLKHSLMPYLYSQSVQCCEKGLPMLRSMALEFPEDPACAYLDRQYMLGDSLLVAPVFSEDGTAQFYLPEGLWTDFLTGEEIQGGRWLKKQYGYLSLPLYVRPGTLLPVGSGEKGAVYDYGQAELRAYGLKEGSGAVTLVYDTAGKLLYQAKAALQDGKITVTRTSGD